MLPPPFTACSLRLLLPATAAVVAVAERGWASKDTRDPVDAHARFHEWRCKVGLTAATPLWRESLTATVS